MSKIRESILVDNSYENGALNYEDIQRAKARRYCVLYDRLQIENPTWRSAQLCETLGVSAQRLNKYRHLLGAPKRVTKMTTEQRQAAQRKGQITRKKNLLNSATIAAYNKFLAELKGVEVDEMKRLINDWEKEHGMPDMAPSPAGEGASDPRLETSSPHSGNYPPFAGTSRSSARKKRGGSLAAREESGALFQTAQPAPDRSAVSPDDAGYTQFNERLNDWKRTA